MRCTSIAVPACTRNASASQGCTVARNSPKPCSGEMRTSLHHPQMVKNHRNRNRVMRTVDRTSVPFPSVLADKAKVADAVQTYRQKSDSSKANKGLYAHDDVKLALQRLYHQKCSLC